MKTQEKLIYTAAGLIVCGLVAAAVLLPKLISRYYDAAVVGIVRLEEKDGGEGDNRDLNADEKLYILSNALNNRILPQSDHFAAIRWQDILNNKTQSYAFRPVYRESEYNAETRAEALRALKVELDLLREKGVLPALDFNPDNGDYEAALFSAIDILKPQNNVTVWQISFDGAKIRSGLADCIMDARTHKLYSVSVRAKRTWTQYDESDAVRRWAEYLGAGEPDPYEPGNPWAEDAAVYKKYAFHGMDGSRTIVTAGYYEGVGEFFIRIAE